MSDVQLPKITGRGFGAIAARGLRAQAEKYRAQAEKLREELRKTNDQYAEAFAVNDQRKDTELRIADQGMSDWQRSRQQARQIREGK